MVEGGQCTEVTVAQDYAPTTGTVAERNPQNTVLVRSVLGSLQPDCGLRAILVVFVDDPELVARRTHFLENPQVALRDECTTALPVADELDDVDATLVKFGEIELPLGSPHGGILVLEDSLPGRRQTVQVDRGVAGLEVSAVEVEGVDLESLDQKRVDVLDGELELHRLVRLEELLVFGGKIEVDPILEQTIDFEQQVNLHQVDVTDPTQVQRFTATIINQFEGIDVVANIAGGFIGGLSVSEMDTKKWDLMMDLNLKSVFLMCKAVLPHLSLIHI